MQEAWLLIDEAALREAAGRPSDRQPVDTPKLKELERIAHPKAMLYEALRKASELTGRRARQFRPAVAARRLAALIGDWSPLHGLAAFRSLHEATATALSSLGPSA